MSEKPPDPLTAWLKLIRDLGAGGAALYMIYEIFRMLERNDAAMNKAINVLIDKAGG